MRHTLLTGKALTSSLEDVTFTQDTKDPLLFMLMKQGYHKAFNHSAYFMEIKLSCLHPELVCSK